MRLFNNVTAFAILSAATCFMSCEDVQTPEPNVETSSSTSSANFLMVNASPDAPSLDFFVNNVKTGPSVVQGLEQTAQAGAYSNAVVTSNGVLANSSIRVKATSGTIGGVLGSSDLIFRAGNNNTNNFQAVDSGFYTFIVMDTISRPRPVRKLDESNFGDTTFVVRNTGEQIGVVEWRALAPLVADRNRRADAIGTVPLGSSDPGGVRFLVVTDQLPLPSTTRFPKPAAGRCAVRFIMASPNVASFSGSVTFNVGATAVTSGIFSNQLSFVNWIANNVNIASVGSRSVTNNAYNTTITANDATPVPQTLVVRQGATEIARIDNYVFKERGVYTVVLSGNRRNLPMTLSIIKNK